jgi:glycosyltransferase involved in cell wall biosynthesis
MKSHLFIYPNPTENGRVTSETRYGPDCSISRLEREPRLAARQIDEVVKQRPDLDVLAFWDERLGVFPLAALDRFFHSLDDVWHPGASLNDSPEPDLLRYIQPLWLYRREPEIDLPGAVNWKVNLRAAFLRAEVLRKLGGLDGGFETLSAAAWELGLRWLKAGAVCRQQPTLVSARSGEVELVSLADRYRLIHLHYSAFWTRYILARRLVGAHPLREVRAWRKGCTTLSSAGQAYLSPALRSLDSIALPEHSRISVVLPTYGRYRYVAELLQDLRTQTIKPFEVLIADGNPSDERRPDVYDEFADLPLKVIWVRQGGICLARNECLKRASGDYVLFLDDDSRIDAENLEWHLRVLTAYGADVSVGPAYYRDRPDLPPEQRKIACTFMDCGTTLCRRSLLQRIGGFDMQFNEHLAGEDGEFGVRMVRAGALMLNNPFAKRFHYLAPVGGARTSRNNLHRFSRWSFLPRPVASVHYLARRHFEKSASWDAVWQSWILLGWRRSNKQAKSFGWKARTLVAELIALPISLIRLWRSLLISRRMLKEGPSIPSLDPTTSITNESFEPDRRPEPKAIASDPILILTK